MPAVSQFYGIVIYMYFEDHNPPLGLVLDWAELHRQELRDNWNRLRKGESVARINPLRFQRKPTADFDETIDKMLASARRFDPGRIKVDQVARAGGPPEETT